jgi:hypothetical protein
MAGLGLRTGCRSRSCRADRRSKGSNSKAASHCRSPSNARPGKCRRKCHTSCLRWHTRCCSSNLGCRTDCLGSTGCQASHRPSRRCCCSRCLHPSTCPCHRWRWHSKACRAGRRPCTSRRCRWYWARCTFRLLGWNHSRADRARRSCHSCQRRRRRRPGQRRWPRRSCRSRRHSIPLHCSCYRRSTRCQADHKSGLCHRRRLPMHRRCPGLARQPRHFPRCQPRSLRHRGQPILSRP